MTSPAILITALAALSTQMRSDGRELVLARAHGTVRDTLASLDAIPANSTYATVEQAVTASEQRDAHD